MLKSYTNSDNLDHANSVVVQSGAAVDAEDAAAIKYFRICWHVESWRHGLDFVDTF